jgi:hypothetical protein
MRNVLLAIALALLIGWAIGAQTVTAPPLQIGVPNASSHTSCTVTASMTQLCLASDGLWVSVSGAAYVQVQTGTPVAAGITSIKVCNLANTVCNSPNTGPAVVLNIPASATSSTTTSLQ